MQLGDPVQYRFVVGLGPLSKSLALVPFSHAKKIQTNIRKPQAIHVTRLECKGERFKRQRWHSNYMRSRGKRIGFVVTEVMESSGGLLPEWNAYKSRAFYAIRGPTAV
jgi:hypothetical protein